MENKPAGHTEKIKTGFKKKWFLGLLIGVLILICLLVFVNNNTGNRHFSKVEIEIKPLPNNINFLTEKDILPEIQAMALLPEFKKAVCEQNLAQNPYVANAEVYIDLKKTLHVAVKQRQPIARIINNKQQQYYLDATGTKFKVVSGTSARVLVVNGYVSEGLLPADTVKTVTLQEVFKIASTIEVKVFWKQFTEQLYVDKNKDIILIPKVGSFTIVMGDASRLDEKFNDLEVFINNVLPKVGWEKYKQLSVKYKGQVVTVKN